MLVRGTEGREKYADRRETIWMDNLQEIRQKMEEQTRRYEDIFKNEFVLTILKSCEKARDDLKQINGELSKLHFSAKYQFDVHYVEGRIRVCQKSWNTPGTWMSGAVRRRRRRADDLWAADESIG